MSFKDSITKTTELSYFKGAIPVNYQYTYGIAGDKYFRAILEKGEFVASVCQSCGAKMIYPLIYCEECYSEIQTYESVGSEGELYSYTACCSDHEGHSHQEPHMIGLIKFKGVNGGVIHRLNIPPEDLEMGMKVVAKFRPLKDRTGNIEDLICFEKG